MDTCAWMYDVHRLKPVFAYIKQMLLCIAIQAQRKEFSCSRPLQIPLEILLLAFRCGVTVNAKFQYHSISHVTGPFVMPRLHWPAYIRRCDLVPFCNSVLTIDAAPVLPQ